MNKAFASVHSSGCSVGCELAVLGVAVLQVIVEYSLDLNRVLNDDWSEVLVRGGNNKVFRFLVFLQGTLLEHCQKYFPLLEPKHLL